MPRSRLVDARPARLPPVSLKQRYRMRTPSTGREIFLEAEPGKVYRDRDTGEDARGRRQGRPAGARRTSRLPWAVENLRFCNWCDQLAQKDLNDCPTCGRRMDALGAPVTATDSFHACAVAPRQSP